MTPSLRMLVERAPRHAGFRYVLTATAGELGGATLGFALPYEATDPYEGALAVLGALPGQGAAFAGEAVTIRGPWTAQRLRYEFIGDERLLARADDWRVMGVATAKRGVTF